MIAFTVWQAIGYVGVMLVVGGLLGMCVAARNAPRYGAEEFEDLDRERVGL